jgi:hypothetical protein
LVENGERVRQLNPTSEASWSRGRTDNVRLMNHEHTPAIPIYQAERR